MHDQRSMSHAEECPDPNEIATTPHLKPGDLLIHSALLIHRADANASADRPRRAIGAIFYGASAVVDEAEYEARQLRIKQRAATLPGQSASSVGLATAKTGEG